MPAVMRGDWLPVLAIELESSSDAVASCPSDKGMAGRSVGLPARALSMYLALNCLRQVAPRWLCPLPSREWMRAPIACRRCLIAEGGS